MYRTSVWVGKDKDGAPVFVFLEGESQAVCFNFLPAYPFLNGQLVVERGKDIFCASTEISRVEPAQSVAFHGLHRLMSFYGNSPNFTRRWELHPYDFIPGDQLVFATVRNTDLIDVLLRLFVFRKSLGSEYVTGSAPPNDLDRKQMKRFHKLKKDNSLKLLI